MADLDDVLGSIRTVETDTAPPAFADFVRESIASRDRVVVEEESEVVEFDLAEIMGDLT
jgi:hypothetical protein